ncbi:ribosomal protein S18-alanine N-acetyltransferase [Neotabrizicola shimadae]|uniref:[Ribosomal protein bS18]-alanine N-acetyltransferase n=1 Tax=Neotabrizicola shimadae TaxID=2807096 RepID=A0A8G0ZX76_9RHOB|nr:ribosomal protein S18-alanine N-acetyltransferase [Neotabrizicola shimadae]QYZ70536.1 ribosomal protein S18-alanine N-acetyltransferase [Neotabrizicola shimadae]
MTPEALAVLHAESFVMPRPWSAAEFVALMASPGVFLLTEGSAGFLMGRALAGEAELLTVAVAPAARRQGIGARLMVRFLDEARQRGAERAFLEVAAGNDAARTLYAAAGFAEAGRRRGYYRNPQGGAEDAVVMARPLG